MENQERQFDGQITNSIDRAAQRLDMSAMWVRKQIAAGQLRSVRFGRSVRILESDLREFAESRAATV